MSRKTKRNLAVCECCGQKVTEPREHLAGWSKGVPVYTCDKEKDEGGAV